MYKFVVILCFFCVAAVIAYDFSDSDFNEYVMQDIIEMSTDDGLEQQLRFKRGSRNRSQRDDDDKKCKSSNKKQNGFFKCCKDDNENEKQHEKVKDLKKQCMNEIRDKNKKQDQQEDSDSFDMLSCDKVNRTKEEYICVSECVGKKLNIIDKDGNLNEEAARNHVKYDLSHADWQKKMADQIANKCITETKEDKDGKDASQSSSPAPSTSKDSASSSTTTTAATTAGKSSDASSTTQATTTSAGGSSSSTTTTVATPTTNDSSAKTDEPTKCNSAALKFGHCVWREFIKACPQNKQSDSKKCSALREKLDKGEKIDFHSFHGGSGRHHHHHRSKSASGESSEEKK